MIQQVQRIQHPRLRQAYALGFVMLAFLYCVLWVALPVAVVLRMMR